MLENVECWQVAYDKNRLGFGILLLDLLTVTIMYTLRPIFPTLDETSVSTCMYKMRKITLHTEVGECIKSETVPPPAVDDVR